jgi:CRP-like cAMP-binding protein
MGVRRRELTVSQAMKEELLHLGTVVSRRKGTILFARGDAVTGVFLVRGGKVLLALDKINTAFPPRTLGVGSVIGLPAAVGGSPYSLTATVVEDAELTFVPRDALVDCLKQNPSLCFEVMEILSREISGTRYALKRSSTAVLHKA